MLIACYSRNLLRRCIFSEIKYRDSENIAIKRLDLVHGKVMRQITFRYHRHNEFLLYILGSHVVRNIIISFNQNIHNIHYKKIAQHNSVAKLIPRYVYLILWLNITGTYVVPLRESACETDMCEYGSLHYRTILVIHPRRCSDTVEPVDVSCFARNRPNVSGDSRPMSRIESSRKF